MQKYYHDESYHRISSPQAIVPVLIDLFSPNSVVDIGCGTGNFLNVFKKMGVRKILGIDGSWVKKSILFKYLDDDEFLELNLENKFTLKEKYDIALCLEVAEHLSAQASDILIDNLCNCSNIIIFSAAIPMQGGQNHINEQWPSYWEKKFESYGFKIYDYLRPYFWNNDKVDVWYQQNILIVARNDHNFDGEILKKYRRTSVMDIVHPGIYNYKTNTIRKIYSGNLKLYFKAGLALIKRKYFKWLLFF